VEYITNKAIFKEIEFYVDENVLIPRIETEKIIDLAIARINAKNKIKFADIGTGSGCIGITLSQYLTKLNIQHKGFLSDIDNQAVKIARINAKSILGKQNNLKIFKSNLFDKYSPNIKFDLVLANLPYVPIIRDVDKSILYEPSMAIFSGKDGLKTIKRFLQQVNKFIDQNSLVVMEIDSNQVEYFLNLNNKQFIVEIFKDQFDKDRFVVLKLK